MKKEITVTIAALGFISSAVGINAYTTDSEYICDASTSAPLVMNFAEEFTDDIIQNQKIESLTFSIDCKTNLSDDRAYCTQGMIYYYSNGEFQSRSFADIVSVDDPEFVSIQKQDSVCTEITVGTEERPLNMDINNDITLEWTWITPERLSMYELSVEMTDGTVYQMANEDYYTVTISEKMEDDKVQIKSDNEFMFPIKGRYCVTSVYGWDNDRWHDGLDVVPYSDLNIYSSCSGTVVYAGWNQGYGNYVSVLDDNGEYRFCYGHLDSINVEYGQRVEKGDILGITGNTGNSTGLHLDYSCMLNEEETNIAEIIGVTNDYGDYPAITDIIVDENKLAIECLSINKYFEVGSLGANGINPDDSGACSLSLIQMRGSNAKKLLNYLYENNKSVYTNIAHKYNDGYVDYLSKSDNWWESHSISDGGNEYNFYSELLDEDSMIELEYEFFINHEKNIIDDIKSSCGTEDERYIKLFTRVFNYLPYGSTANAMRSGISYEEACNLAINDPNILKAEELISMINNNSYEIVTVESLKGER